MKGKKKPEYKVFVEEYITLCQKMPLVFFPRAGKNEAACGGHLKVLQWAQSQGCPWDKWTCACAAEGGHLKVLQWAQSQGCPWNKDWCVLVAKNGGHLEVWEWAREQHCPAD